MQPPSLGRRQKARYLKSKRAKFALSRAMFLARKIEDMLVSSTYRDKEKDIREYINRNSSDVEYVLLTDASCKSIIHTNVFREGIVFDDPVGERSVKSPIPLKQIFIRDTGQLVLDASSPIIVNGERRFTLRVGLTLIRGSLKLNIYLFTILPVVLVAVAAGLITHPPLEMIWIPMGAIGMGSTFAYWLTRKYDRALKDIFTGTWAIAHGDLTFLSTPQVKDDLGKVVYEVNKISLGLRSIISELAIISEEVRYYGEEQVSSTADLKQGIESITASMSDLTSQAENQHSSLVRSVQLSSEVDLAMKEMASSVERTVSVSQEALRRSQSGTDAVNDSMSQMETIRNAVLGSRKIVYELSDLSRQIGHITGAMTGVAEKTNMLSLNASIEAARAGDQGRGFAVVATEVGKLAEESNRSAREILSIIQKTQERIAEAVAAMDTGARQVDMGMSVISTAGESIHTLVHAVESTSREIQQNHTQSGELLIAVKELLLRLQSAREISQMNEGVSRDVSAITDHQLLSTQTIVANALGLAEAADELQRLISRFQL